MKHLTKSPEETQKLAEEFARNLKGGEIILLNGDLGAGKTCFVQGLASALDIPPTVYVRSPTFALINEYLGGRLSLYHFDFYRLGDPSELDSLGIEEYLFSDGVTAIEWADKFPDELPENAISINFRVIDENSREINFL
ncbi:MAG: tRNA (adenosine(37)-N6)-threonylcarbamoyltransferase complex ATPase subunit type 1 TsaE [Deltaproteobacteria bacterium]|jgi:tRNA threonylcarbamoyladenosine biosynthesis protein TsaE|nr:tRNA (adenosine(37)-N6)-threonylcarbamoyltransferase complex ATPase subunit type 1 TsaE [Deltaproteobacteria bacterium]